jgi:hypothetical protein
VAAAVLVLSGCLQEKALWWSYELPGIEVVDYLGNQVIVLDIEQPLDHADPTAGSFSQRVIITERDDGNRD